MMINIKEMRNKLGITQSEFASRYNIPFRTIQNWEKDVRKPPEYVLKLLEQRIQKDLINKKTITLPKYNPKKKDLPKRNDYLSAVSWLKDIKNILGNDFVFALDEALMCQGYFLGHSDEYIIWVYGEDSLSNYNGVVVIGNKISPYNIKEKNGLRYTNFNRTINDSLANENILDMQGITEAISKYYYSNNKVLDDIYVSPEYQKRFDKLLNEAISYYNN